MAVRVELVTQGSAGALTAVVSASDTDEQRLFAVLAQVSLRCPALDLATHHGGSLTAPDVATALAAVKLAAGQAVTADGETWEQRWVDVVRTVLATAEATGAPVQWSTRYDTGGTVDDGPDEFATTAQLLG